MSLVNDVLLNWKIFLLIFTFITSVSIANTRLSILPVTGINFLICSLTVWFLSMWITLIGLHKILQNKPGENSSLKLSTPKKHLKPNIDGIKLLVQDIDKYFISKWYSNISANGDFTEESKVVLEEVINKLLEVQLVTNNSVLLHGALNVYLKHLKEFRRTLKRQEKYGGHTEALYRYSHTCSSSTDSKEYYIHQLTVTLLSHFLNWELWNSFPCHVLVSIVARKLTMYILYLVSSPELINYFLLKLVASDQIKNKYDLGKFNRISIRQYTDVTDSPRRAQVVVSQTKPCDVKIEKVVVEEASELEIVKLVEPKPAPVLKKIVEEVRPVPVSKPVKIHEPKSTTMKTWSDTQDLFCVSLGQDPLIETELGKSSKNNIWDTCSVKSSDESTGDSPTSAANLFMNEMKHITSMEGLKSSIKPISDATVHTLHNIKDLQETTVNSALHKIGDFQDEAAGMVEGLLDFGRAGLRKGLRLTGLQDNIENAKALGKQTKKKAAKLTRSDSQEKMSSGESVDSVWVNPLQFDSPSFDGQILLEKPKKSDTEAPLRLDGEHPVLIPYISTDTPGDTDSPDPEYEENADLASTIAKLRSLLQQKSSESSLSTPAISPYPLDEFNQKLMLDPEKSDLDEVDGVMPSFYKFCTKTATGVFQNTLNTIKTALPSNIPEVDHFGSTERWIFVQNDQSETDLLSRVKKLVTERKDFCTVDTAYEAIDSLDSLQQSTVDALFATHVQFEDELDEFEVKLPLTKALIDILCELLADADTPFIQEPMVRGVLLSFGLTIERNIVAEADKLMENFCTNFFTIPEVVQNETLYLELDEFVEVILSCIPEYLRHVFGKTTLKKALVLFVLSLQIQRINQDVLLQILELICMRLIEESSRMSPPASA